MAVEGSAPGPGTAVVVEREVRIEVPPDVVFAFFTDPDRMVEWKGVTATLDPRPGGVYRVDINGRDVARGEYVEVVPPERLVFTWGWEAEGHPVPPGSSVVEVTFVPDGDGTIVRLRHSDLPLGAEDHDKGWKHYLGRLVVAAAGGDPGRDPWLGPSPPAP